MFQSVIGEYTQSQPKYNKEIKIHAYYSLLANLMIHYQQFYTMTLV